MSKPAFDKAAANEFYPKHRDFVAQLETWVGMDALPTVEAAQHFHDRANDLFQLVPRAVEWPALAVEFVTELEMLRCRIAETIGHINTNPATENKGIDAL